MHFSKPLIQIFGLTFDLSILMTTTIASILAFLIALVATRSLTLNKPSRLQNFIEWTMEFVENMMENAMGKTRNLFILSTGFSLFLYLIIANFIGIPFSFVTGSEHPISWWKSPTADPHITMTLAIMIMAYSHFVDVRMHGLKSYFKGYFKPFKAFFLINILEQLCTTLTLGLRLFGNIYAGEVMLTILAGSASNGVIAAMLTAFPMMLWQGFCLFIGSIQAYIFVTLMMVYIGHRVVQED